MQLGTYDRGSSDLRIYNVLPHTYALNSLTYDLACLEVVVPIRSSLGTFRYTYMVGSVLHLTWVVSTWLIPG